MLSLVEFIQEKIFAPFDIQIMKRSFFLDNYTPVKNISTLDLRQDNAIDSDFFQVVTSHSLTSKMLHNSQKMLAAFTVYSALKYIVENEKRGDLVECGVFWSKTKKTDISAKTPPPTMLKPSAGQKITHKCHRGITVLFKTPSVSSKALRTRKIQRFLCGTSKCWLCFGFWAPRNDIMSLHA